MRYDVRSISTETLIAENVSVETALALIKGYEVFNPNMVRDLSLIEHSFNGKDTWDDRAVEKE